MPQSSEHERLHPYTESRGVLPDVRYHLDALCNSHRKVALKRSGVFVASVQKTRRPLVRKRY